MSLPYQVDFRGYPACPCLAEWLPRYEAELQRRGVLAGPLRIYQLTGNAPASGGVHAEGGAFDITDYLGGEDVAVARQMGADATWARVAGFSTVHIHGVLTGCPHNGPARYQIDAVRAGFNGLGAGGRGGPDDGPRPLSGRSWRQGLEWARQQEDDMKPEDWDRLEKLLDAKLSTLGDTKIDLGDGKAKRKLGAVLGNILGKVRSDRTS